MTLTDGMLVVDKPAGISSAKALAPIKARAGKSLKVGHAGTLDPFATGVLLVLLGDATRLSDLAMRLQKVYRATVRFGIETDTLDPDGEVVAECDPGPERALPVDRFKGRIEQLPPAFSALKVGGRRAYKLARAGKQPELKPRSVYVHHIEVTESRWPDVDLHVICGAGTYIRSLARDLGKAVGLPAHLTALRRTAIGPFQPESVERIVPPLEITNAAGLNTVNLFEHDALAFVQGRSVICETEGAVAVTKDDLFLGLGECIKGDLRPSAVFSKSRAAVEAGCRD